MPRRGTGRVVPVVVGSVGVLALVAAGWVAMDRGLLPAIGASSGGSVDRLADVTETPSEAWTYNYLPRGSGDYTSSLREAGTGMVILRGPASYSETPGEGDWTVTMVDLESGEEEWSVPLDVPVDDGHTAPSVSITGVLDDRVLIQSVSFSYDGSSGDTSLTDVSALDLDDGAELWRTDLVGRDGLSSMHVVREPAALLLVDDLDVTRLDPDDPDGEALWRVPHPFSSAQEGAIGLGGDFVRITDYSGTQLVLDLQTGEEPQWFDGVSPELTHQVVAGQVYRTESGSRGSYLERLEEDGSVSWSADADTFAVRETGSGVVIFALERDRSPEGSGYEYVQRIDPRTGEKMWEDGIEADFLSLESVLDDVLELYTDRGSSELYSLDDGERVARLRVDPNWTGRQTLYSLSEGRLKAHSTEGDRLWSTRVSETTSIMHTPGYLVTNDNAAGRLTRWE